MSDRKIPDAVIARQIEASDPAVSAWVSANAGSGKTYVLAQRVIRLLLDGTDPAKILCLTYTKAAAANMANRVFERLAGWTTLDDAALEKEIRQDRAEARRRQAPRARPQAVRRGAGDAGRPEGADHPRLLHAAPAAVPVRGRRRRALPGAGRDAAEADDRGDPARRAARRGGEARQRGGPRARDHHHARERFRIPASRSRKRSASASTSRRGSRSAGGIDGAMAELSRALGIEPDDTIEQRRADLFDRPLIARMPNGRR